MQVAVGASESAMSSLLGKLGSLLAQEYTLISGVRSEIQYMNDELASMHAFLRKLARAAAAGATHDEQTKSWIEQVRDVAYDIEDSVDDFAHRLGRQPRGEGLLANLRRAWYTMTTLWARRDIAARIVDLKNRAQHVGERRTRYGVQDPKPDSGSKPSRPARPYATDHLQPPARQVIGTAKPVGQEEAIGDIGNWLTEERTEDRLRIVAIVGFGGLGKTTMALELHRRFGEKFESRASVQASQKMNLASLLRSILKQVMPQKDLERKVGDRESGLESRGHGIEGWRVAVCDEILRRCEGIPLFITGMADWLKQQQRQRKKYAFYSLEVPLFLKQFEQALSAAYNELPSELRLILLYMSMLPQGYIFEKDRLTMKWLNEGLIQEDFWDEQSHKVAEEYFSKMVDRNIIIPVVANKRHEVDACQWYINHFMLQFLTSKSTEMGFVSNSNTLISATAPAKIDGIKTGIPRRLYQHHPDTKVLQMDLSRIRSLAVSGVGQIPFHKFTYLVVLDLEGSKKLKDGDLLEICSNRMCLLVFLSIRNTGVGKLPQEIKELCSLRTLDVSHTQICDLPLEVCELEYLCKLDLRSTQIRLLPNQIARLCRLQDLLIDIDATLCKYPISMIKAFGELENLRVFVIQLSFQQCINGAYRAALQSSLQKWRHLKSLTMKCGLGCNLEFLSLIFNHPPKKIEKFKVTAGRFISVPQWIGRHQHLAFLQITVCKLEPHDLKILADLLRLRCLVLGLEFIPREEIVVGSDGFKMLERLSISFLVPWITFQKGAMLRLAYLELEVISTPARESAVPSCLSNLQSLNEVVLHYNQKWCSNSSSIKKTVEAVKKEVGGHCNPIELIINSTKHDVQKFDETGWATKIQGEVSRKQNRKKSGRGECETKSSAISQDKEGTVIF